MADVHSKEVRSYNMSQIKGKETKPEVLVRKYLLSKGFRYKKNDSRLPGKPDIVLPKYKTVIFVNGCFWHMHKGCKYFAMPKNNAEFWREKLEKNVQRDAEEKAELEKRGWKVIIVWECELKKDSFEKRMDRLREEVVVINQTRSIPVR